jgi:hypothetical protein
MQNDRVRRKARLARRRKPRGYSRLSCYRGPLGLGPNVALCMEDLSESGLCFLSKETLTPGHPIQVKLDNPTVRKTIVVPATVVWTNRSDNGSYRIGAAFERTLAYALVQLFARP